MKLRLITANDDPLVQRLRQLPTVTPPTATLEALDKLAMTARPRRSTRWAVSAALAASVAMVIVSLALMTPSDEMLPAPVVAANTATDTAPSEVESLAAQSAYLDRMLATLPTRGRVQRVATASTISALEDRVAAIDTELNETLRQGGNDATRVLLRERVGLMSSLVTLRAEPAAAAAVWL
ncbi:MAG: hypothetical protein AAF290_01755 [Pseudomonadota bacterium]